MTTCPELSETSGMYFGSLFDILSKGFTELSKWGDRELLTSENWSFEASSLGVLNLCFLFACSGEEEEIGIEGRRGLIPF